VDSSPVERHVSAAAPPQLPDGAVVADVSLAGALEVPGRGGPAIAWWRAATAVVASAVGGEGGAGHGLDSDLDTRTSVRVMLNGIDLSDIHQVENVRRSIVMLLPGARALKRDDALLLLDALQEARHRE